MPTPRAPRTMTTRTTRGALAAIVFACAMPALAQPGQKGLVVLGGGLDPNAKEGLQNASVNDSPEARKDIETAHTMERLKDWNKAATWYQEVLEKYRGRVVAWKANGSNVIDRYRGIKYEVKESLSAWPPEGVAAYRARYEATAAAILEAAAPDDKPTLTTVYWTYFITEAGKQAGLRLIDLHLEAGEFDAAARLGDDLLQWYPAAQLVVERPRLLFRAALAHHLNGDDAAAQAKLAELKDKYPDAAAPVFGRDEVLATALASQLAAGRPTTRGIGPDSWPTFCGSPSRSQVSSAQGRPGAKVYSIDLPRRAPKAANGDKAATAFQHDEDAGLTLGIMPVVDAGQLFFQDGARVYAVNLESGVPLPGWAATYGGDRRGQYQLRPAADAHGQYTLTLTETGVLAVMGNARRRFPVLDGNGNEVNPNGGGEQGTRLVCLERDTGRERWKPIDLATLRDENLRDDERERLRALDFSGSPLVVGDNVFVMARGSKDPQFENCYVLCFDAITGRYRWSSLIASANTNFNVYGDNSAEPAQNTTSHLAYAGGRVYVLTNLGALAALDAYGGSVVWLTIYPRDASRGVNDGAAMNWNMRRGGMAAAQPPGKPWSFDPVFAQDGRLFLLPSDSKYLLVYDATTGAELKRISVEDWQEIPLTRPDTLLGVLGDRVLLSGGRDVACLNWRTFDPTRGIRENVRDGGWWNVFIRHERTAPVETIRGRAFVTGDSVFVPTVWQVQRLAFASEGGIVEQYPDQKTGRNDWDETEGPGNVLVTSEHVIIAGSRSVNVYTDMTMARAKLDREVAAAPLAVEPRLRYAEVMFAAGQVPVSLEKMREAIGLLGGPGAMRAGEERRRVFSDALAFAQKLAKDKSPKGNEQAVQYFDLAGGAAESASEQVNFRVSRARFATDNIEPDSFLTAVRLYQEILSRPELRIVMVAQEGAGGVDQAGALAERQIGEIVRKEPAAYAPVEAQAAAALAAARAAGDPDQLLGVAQVYPNATATAAAAMLEAAEAYERAANPRLATQVLRKIYRKYGSGADRARIVEAMVRNYLTLPNGYDVAVLRLRQAASQYGAERLTKPLALPGGKTLENATFAEALAAAQAARPKDADADLPDPRLPALPADDAQGNNAEQPKPFLADAQDPNPVLIPDVTALLTAQVDVRGEVRHDRVVAVVNGALAVFKAGEPKPLMSGGEWKDAPRGAAWAGSDLIAWSGKELMLVDGARARWTVPLAALAPIDVVTTAGGATDGSPAATDADPNAAADANADALLAQRQRQAMLRGRRFGVRAAVAPVEVVEEPVATGEEQVWQVRPLGDRVIVATSTGRLVCLDRKDGRPLWQTRLSNHPLDRLLANEDFTVVRLTEGTTVQLIALDNYDGQVQMRQPFAGNAGNVPVNLALSPDGMLVYTLPGLMRGHDLYESTTSGAVAGVRRDWEYPANRDAAPAANLNAANINAAVNGGGTPPSTLFAGCNKPNQLVIRGRTILAIEQAGRSLSVHSLDTGALLKHRNHEGEQPALIDTVLPTGFQASQGNGNDVTVTIRLAGAYVYLTGPRSLQAYDLDRPAEANWYGSFPGKTAPNLREAVPCTTHLLLLGEPGGRVNAARPQAPVFSLYAYRRGSAAAAPNVDAESGLLEYVVDLTDPTGITQWQPVDGGVYYLTGDHKLHLLRGSRP